MSAAKRKVYGAAFKGKVGLEAIRELKTINEIAEEHGVHPACQSALLIYQFPAGISVNIVHPCSAQYLMILSHAQRVRGLFSHYGVVKS